MSKESFEGDLTTAQVTHIVGGAAEQFAEAGESIAEHMESGESSEGVNRVLDRSADALRHAGASAEAIRNVATGAGGGFLIGGGLFAMMKGYEVIRNASGLRISQDSTQKALDNSGVEVSQEKAAEIHENLKSALKAKEHGICDGSGFVKSKNRAKGNDIGDKFAAAVKQALEKSSKGSSFDAEDTVLVASMTQSLAADLGFVSGKDGSLVSYNGTQNIMTSRYTPSADDLVTKLGIDDHAQSERFQDALEANGIIEDGRCVKAPTIAELSACYSMAEIAYDDDKLEKSQLYFNEKSRAVAEVPTLRNSINMNAKVEGGLVTTMGLASLAAGVLVLLAGFAGIAGLAAASSFIAIGGLTATATLLTRDTIADVNEGRSNRAVMQKHRELAQSKDLPQGQRLEHSLQAKLYESKAKESAGISVGNGLFMASIALTLLVVLTVVSGGGALGVIAMVTMSSFAVGAVATIAAKKYLGKEVDNIAKDLAELKAISKAQEQGIATPEQEARLEALQGKYQGVEKLDPTLAKIASSSEVIQPEVELSSGVARGSDIGAREEQPAEVASEGLVSPEMEQERGSDVVVGKDEVAANNGLSPLVEQDGLEGDEARISDGLGGQAAVPGDVSAEEHDHLVELLQGAEFQHQVADISGQLHDGGVGDMKVADHVAHSTAEHDEAMDLHGELEH